MRSKHKTTKAAAPLPIPAWAMTSARSDLIHDAKNMQKTVNQTMARDLETGECLDVSNCDRTPDGAYALPSYVDGRDYADAATEEWIHSIGKAPDGTHYAATDGRYYQVDARGFECVWLR